jgi:L,D-peptidoglycan transpeptidase YkuD (ErfK/YbiS/YcfS/YnhG family)
MGAVVTVDPAGYVAYEGLRFRCALGKGGVRVQKQEGDGATPAGLWPVRRLLYRPDRGAAPFSAYPTLQLTAQDGWCDDPNHADYNHFVALPHPARCEQLWRDDGVYDVILPLGYNDDPVIKGRGSAIFLHVAHDDFRPTEGCVALRKGDLLTLLAALPAGASLAIGDPPHC